MLNRKKIKRRLITVVNRYRKDDRSYFILECDNEIAFEEFKSVYSWSFTRQIENMVLLKVPPEFKQPSFQHKPTSKPKKRKPA